MDFSKNSFLIAKVDVKKKTICTFKDNKLDDVYRGNGGSIFWTES